MKLSDWKRVLLLQEIEALEDFGFTDDEEETRCRRCQEREICPAFETGVLYPCPYFEEEVDHGTEK